MRDEAVKPWHRLSLRNLFVLVTLAAVGALVFQVGYARRPDSASLVILIAVAGTVLTFAAYLFPTRQRIASTILILILYALMIAGVL